MAIAAGKGLLRNQQIDILAPAQAQIAERQHGERCALDEQDRQTCLVEQTLQPQRFSGHRQILDAPVAPPARRSRERSPGGTFGVARVSPS